MFQKILTGIILAAALALLFVGIPAHVNADSVKGEMIAPSWKSHQIRRPAIHVKNLRLVGYVEHKGSYLNAVFNDGRFWTLGACQYEDSERCFWDASRRGNGTGDSFVRLFHRTFYLKDVR